MADTKLSLGVPPPPRSERDDDLASVPRPGDVIAGKLRVERIVGAGGMGIVVVAEHLHLRKTVAVKLLRSEVIDAPNVVERFLREARAMAALYGDHVVRVTDVGTQENGLPYMVMEHLHGRDLGDLLAERGKLPVVEAVDYVLQACEGIAEAHAAGIVHRDLKPGNIFLTRGRDGAPLVKVLDFGVSKLVDARWDEKSLTDTSTIIGSPAYMSPEQIRSSKTVDARTDIWALGVTLYKLVSGEQPFSSDTPAGMCAAIVLGEVPPLRAHADVPPAFEAVVMRCLAKGIDARYQSVGELASALRPFASEAGRASAERVVKVARSGATTQPEVRSATAARIDVPRASNATRVVAVVVIVASIAAVVLLLTMNRTPPRTEAPPVSAPASTPARAVPPPMPLPALSDTTPAPSVSAAKPLPPPTKPARPPTNDQLIEDRH